MELVQILAYVFLLFLAQQFYLHFSYYILILGPSNILFIKATIRIPFNIELANIINAFDKTVGRCGRNM